MERRKFLEISTVTTAAIITGALNSIAQARFGRSETPGSNLRRPRMFGGCGDYRMMNDSFPGFLEKEIIDFRA